MPVPVCVCVLACWSVGVQAYARFEHSKGDKARVQNVYERCVALCATDHRGWAAYANYTDTHLKVTLPPCEAEKGDPFFGS